MNELFDKLILQILFTVLICASLIFYKYAHGIFYPSTRQHFLKRFYPTKNSSDTLHFFSRIIGIGIIFSEFSFNLSTGIGLAILDFFAKAIFGFFLYLISLYIIDSIVLFKCSVNDSSSTLFLFILLIVLFFLISNTKMRFLKERIMLIA